VKCKIRVYVRKKIDTRPVISVRLPIIMLRAMFSGCFIGSSPIDFCNKNVETGYDWYHTKIIRDVCLEAYFVNEEGTVVPLGEFNEVNDKVNNKRCRRSLFDVVGNKAVATQMLQTIRNSAESLTLTLTLTDVSHKDAAIREIHVHSRDVVSSDVKHLRRRAFQKWRVMTLKDITDVRNAHLHQRSSAHRAILDSMFPCHVVEAFAQQAERLLIGERNSPVSVSVSSMNDDVYRSHANVSIMFMDIVGFTTMAESVCPHETMRFLNTLFGRLDALLDSYPSVFKLETAGDCYIVSSGILTRDPATGMTRVLDASSCPASHARYAADVLAFARDLIRAVRKMHMPGTSGHVKVRVGIHSGNVASGVIGVKIPKFAVFGDAMNTASRMESTGVPDQIHVSDTFSALLPDEPWCKLRGERSLHVKGKGMMNTDLLVV